MIWEQQVGNCCTLHLQGERRESHPGKEERDRVRMKLFTGAGSWGCGASTHSPLVGDIGGESCDRG